jgi:hypothetical protein
MNFFPLPQNLRQTLFLVRRQARGTAGMGFGAQPFHPLLLEHFFPARYLFSVWGL